MSIFKEADCEDTGKDKSTALAEVTKVVKKLLSGRMPGEDEICPEMLKAKDVVGLSWLALLFNVAWRTGTMPL